MERELTPKQQTSEAIRQAESILIMTGQHPSIDQVASTIALSAILRKYGKKVTAVISDDIPAGAKFLPTNFIERTLGGLRDFIVRLDLSQAELDKLKYTIENGKLNVHITPFAGGFHPQHVSFDYGDYQFDLVIILGVASYARIDKIYAQNAELLRQIPLVNIDFHRSNEQYGAVNLVEGTAASLSEILIALSESLQGGMIDEQIATTMLTGIMAATDRFTATHTTAKTMTVAAQMMAMGANQQDVVKGLYRDNRDRPSSPANREGGANRDRKPAPANRETAVSRSNPQPVERAQTVHQAAPVQPASQTPSRPAPRPAPEQPAPAKAMQPTPPAPATPTIPKAPATSPLETHAAPATTSPVQPAPQSPRTDEPAMEELLPPHHIEMSDLPEEPSSSQDLLPEAAPSVSAEPPAPEPLINSTEEPRPASATSRPVQHRAANPTNNPVFAQRLDEFSY